MSEVLPHWLELSGGVAGLVGGIAGLISIGVTVLKPLLTRPRIGLLAYQAESADCAAVPEQPETWIRLRVLNRGKMVAESVQVLVTGVRVTDQRSDGALDVDPAHLVEDRALKWADRPSEFLDLPAGYPRRFDLLRCYRPEVDRNEVEFVFQDQPKDGRARLRLGHTYDVMLAVTPVNARATYHRVMLDLPSSWAPGTRLQSGNLRVEKPSG